MVLLGNVYVRLNISRQRRFSEFLTDIGKRTLEEGIPTDKHLFPDKFHEKIKDEHDHSSTSNKVISTPTPRPLLVGPTTSLDISPFVAATAVEDSTTTHGNQLNAAGHVLDFASPRLSVHASPACPTSQHPTDLVRNDYPFPVLRPIHCVNTPSGRLVHFLDNWKTITQDNWVLQTVVGYKIPFVAPPRQLRPRVTTTRSSIQTKRLNTAIQTLLTKTAIKEFQPLKNQFIS